MDTTFKGATARLKDIDIPRIGAEIGVGEDELHAFMQMEAAAPASTRPAEDAVRAACLLPAARQGREARRRGERRARLSEMRHETLCQAPGCIAKKAIRIRHN